MSEPGGTITSTEALSRAQAWTTNPTPDYDQNATWPDPQGKPYRRDCSGFVSMCWHLATGGVDGPNSSLFAGSIGTPIAKAQLQAGDIMCAVASGNSQFGHVVLFDHWVDAGQTQYFGHEFGESPSPKHHNIPYPYFPSDTRSFNPYRYPKMVGGVGGTTPGPTDTSPYADPTLPGSGLGDATVDQNGTPLPVARALPGVAIIPNKGLSGVSADNRLSDIIIKGQQWTTRITARVLTASMSYSTQEVGQLSMSIQDDETASLFRSGIFNLGTSVDFADQHMDVRYITTPNAGGAPRCDIECRSRAVARLKNDDGPITWGSVDISKWVAARAKEVGARSVVQSLGQTFVVSRQTSNVPENTWDVMTRIATELGVWCFEYDQTVVFAKPSWLATQLTTNRWKVAWASQRHYSSNLTGMPVYTNTYDGTGLATLTFNLIGAQANQVRPGDYFDYDGPGAAAGPWIVNAVTIPVVNRTAIAVSCTRVVDPQPTVLSAQATTP